MKGKEKNPEDPMLVSKSQRRRDALEMKSLARELIKLNQAKLAHIPLDDGVRAAIADARKIHSNVAGKRQLQYVAKLLRRDDPEPILLALEKLEHEAREIAGRLHRVENWRDLLLAGGDQAVGELIRLRSETDTQAIRQLIRNANRETARNRPPASARALFRMLREMDEAEPLPDAAESGVIGATDRQAIDS